MTKFDRASLLLALCVRVIWMPILECHVVSPVVQVQPGSDIQCTPCEVCKEYYIQLYHRVKAKQVEIVSEKIGEENKNIKSAEDAIIAIGEKNVCNLKQEVLHGIDIGYAEGIYKQNPDIDSFTKACCEDICRSRKDDLKQWLKKGVTGARQKLKNAHQIFKRVFNETKQWYSKSNKDEHEL